MKVILVKHTSKEAVPPLFGRYFLISFSKGLHFPKIFMKTLLKYHHGKKNSMYT